MASRLRIRCINKTDRYSPYERISHVGGGTGGSRWRQTQEQTIREIENGEYEYYVEALWSECGANLHRGSIKDIEAYKTPDFWRPTQWHNKIVGLLNIHMIHLIDRKSALHVLLWEEESDKVVMTPMDRWPSPDGRDLYTARP